MPATAADYQTTASGHSMLSFRIPKLWELANECIELGWSWAARWPSVLTRTYPKQRCITAFEVSIIVQSTIGFIELNRNREMTRISTWPDSNT